MRSTFKPPEVLTYLLGCFYVKGSYGGSLHFMPVYKVPSTWQCRLRFLWREAEDIREVLESFNQVSLDIHPQAFLQELTALLGRPSAERPRALPHIASRHRPFLLDPLS